MEPATEAPEEKFYYFNLRERGKKKTERGGKSYFPKMYKSRKKLLNNIIISKEKKDARNTFTGVKVEIAEGVRNSEQDTFRSFNRVSRVRRKLFLVAFFQDHKKLFIFHGNAEN